MASLPFMKRRVGDDILWFFLTRYTDWPFFQKSSIKKEFTEKELEGKWNHFDYIMFREKFLFFIHHLQSYMSLNSSWKFKRNIWRNYRTKNTEKRSVFFNYRLIYCYCYLWNLFIKNFPTDYCLIVEKFLKCLDRDRQKIEGDGIIIFTLFGDFSH